MVSYKKPDPLKYTRDIVVMAHYRVQVVLVLLVSFTAGNRLPALTADSLMKSLRISGPGVVSAEPPQVMLELYANAARATQHGSSFVTAVPAKNTRHGKFFFALPTLAEDEYVTDVEFHLRLSHLRVTERDATQLNNMYKVVVEVHGTNMTVAQLIGRHSAGWLRFSLGAEAVEQVRRGCVGCQQVDIALTATAVTLDGRKLKLKISQGSNKPYRKSLLLLFCQVKEDILHAPLLNSNIHSGGHRVRRSLLDNDLNSTSNNVMQSTIDPNRCHRSSLVVNFEEIGWSHWIVHPADYNAYYCSGGCGFPMGQDMNPTNHALVQSIMRSIKGDQVPVSLCVPTSYAGLTLLLYDNSGNVILRNYEQMVVESCGCH